MDKTQKTNISTMNVEIDTDDIFSGVTTTIDHDSVCIQDGKNTILISKRQFAVIAEAVHSMANLSQHLGKFDPRVTPCIETATKAPRQLANLKPVAKDAAE